MKKIKYAILALAAIVMGACAREEFQPNETLNLSRCLQPMNLNARVSAAFGDLVTFSWDVTKDAQMYVLTVLDSEGNPYMVEEISPSSVPCARTLEADKTYTFTVQAKAENKGDSKVAEYGKNFKTFAVKANLYMKVSERTTSSVSFTWSKDVADFRQVDRIDVYLPGSDEIIASHALTEGEIAAAAATVDGLDAAKEYVFALMYLSASRGKVDAWTTPSTEGFTEIASSDALINALKTSGAKILLKMEGSPYVIDAQDVTGGFSIIGEESADGTKPVVQGEFHIADAWAGGDFYFEGVELSGAPTATAPSGFGFAIQNKNGGTVKGKQIGNITYKNCVISNFTKGLMYEWGNNMVIGDITYESTDIHDINPDGTVGGDVFDIRQATDIKSLSFVNCTIWQGMRTFVRFDAGTLGSLVFENNTLCNLNFVDNANNAGVFGLQITPGSFSFKNNLFLYMTGKAVLAGANAKYIPASDMGVSASNNWFYSLPLADDGTVSYFTANFTQANAAGTILADDPCYNAPGGMFNLNPDSEIADKKVGAPKWWTPYVEEPEDLTLDKVEGNHTWNLANAKYFSGTIKKQMVRDLLFLNASESNSIVVDGGMLNFQNAAVTNRQGVPTVGYLAFKVDAPGSLIVKAQDPSSKGNHFVIGTGPVDGSTIALKGGVSATADMANAQKIVISSITEECLVYVFPSGPVSLEKLAWSTDVTAVNTALPTPVAKADPASITSGEAVDITVSWEPVENAGSYSVVFNGKTSTVNEGTEFVIGGTTTGMLDAGSYKVEVYANPTKDDIYNTESAAGVAAFAVLPAGGGEETELVVKTVDELLAAIAAGKDAVTLAPGEYDLAGALTVTAPLALKGQDGAVVKGGFKLSGAEAGSFSAENITFDANGLDIFMNLDNAEGVVAESVIVKNSVISGYTKSVIYASNTADKFYVNDIAFSGVTVTGQGTGQGVFDLRNGNYQSFTLEESTVTGGRDFLRIDAPCSIYSVIVKNNTLNNLNAPKNAGGVFCVRATPSVYTVEYNIIANLPETISGRAAAAKPKMRKNVWYNIGEAFYTGCIDAALAVEGNGVVLSADPFKDAASEDYTLTNAVVMSLGAGASKWNPAISTVTDSNTITVNTADEFTAAVEAGKTDIRFAAGEFDLSAAAITLTAGMHLSGEMGASVKVGQLNLAEGELGSILIENLDIESNGADNFLNVAGASIARNITVKNVNLTNVKKSVFYGNADGSQIDALVLDNVMMSGLGGGQGTIDIRKGAYGVVAVKGCTIVGGRDFIRADAGKVTGAVNIENNTFDGVTLNNGNGVLYVRSTPSTYTFKNNLFLNENGENNLLSKATGVTVPDQVASNFFYNCTSEKFFTGVITQEIATANGGVILANDPVMSAENNDYTLVDALCLASNVGAPRWNQSGGFISSEITVSSVSELANAIDAGKTGITLKAGTYDLREIAESGVINLINSASLVGIGNVEIIGGFKLGLGMEFFGVENIRFNGAEKAMGNTFEIAEATQLYEFKVKNCDIYGYNKSLFYGNGADSQVSGFYFEGNLVHDFGTGQGVIDIRKGAYGIVSVKNSSFYNGGRDTFRIDKEIASSVAIINNTFAATALAAGNGMLWIRSLAADPSKYTVRKNLFLNITDEGNKSLLAKSGATVPVMDGNWFFNVAEGFFGGAISQEVATAGGGVLTEDPCVNSAEFGFKLVNEDLRKADVGDPRWNSSSPNYRRKK